MKKFILLAALAFALCLTSCSNGDSIDNQLALYNATHQRKEGMYPLCFNGQKLLDLPLHFVDGVNDLPYIEAGDMIDFYKALYVLYDKPVQMTVAKNGAVMTCVRKNEVYKVDASMTIDFENDVIRFDDYNLFMMSPSNSTILDVTSFKFFDEQNRPRLIKKVEPKYLPRFGGPLEINLSNYGIDLVIRDGKYLVPLQTFSDLFFAPAFLSCLYFNGKTVIWGSDLSEKGNKADRELYYQGNKGERSEALARFGYGELCMALDTLYGLKEQHGIQSFDQLFQSQGAVQMSVAASIAPQFNLKSFLTGPSVFDADKAIYHLIGDFLDDNHCKWYNFSYLTGEHPEYKPNGAARERIDGYEKIYKAAREAAYPPASYPKETYPYGVPGYQEVGDTAFVTFDVFEMAPDFMADLDKYYTDDPDTFPDNDTIGLIMKAHKKISENPSIKNVVIDLSVNFGGTADTAVFVAAWFLGETTVSFKDTATGALCSTSYRCDANRDHQFDQNDTLGSRKLFCLVSPCSFSCGNLVPNLFKESEKVTLLGRTSGGGACVVQPISSAWGTCFRISGPMRLCRVKNGSYYDIDQGAQPDHPISDPAAYYDRTALVSYINTLK